MGGVDLMDRMIAHYPHGFKNKKWYLRIFFHFLNISIINSWIIYKENCQNIPLLQFKASIVWTMLQIGKCDTPKRGRPSLQSDPPKKKKKITRYICKKCDTPVCPECMEDFHRK
ncbi:unnamed protein product [Macrosiphum euphorbiae]|uniref:PiggyBac transposable element-derived protein domain-containing protein n=1 Tax=Macrosiphum euphorbiae TaxID=13131 RepID=A0AAV0Y2G6_9HEMI|nr:unnamed protein product [Macrosiphum euphorbiae]